MAQVARNVTDTHDGFLQDKRYLIMDRGTKHSDAFRGIITRAGTNVVRLPPRSPNLNARSDASSRAVNGSAYSPIAQSRPKCLTSSAPGSVFGFAESARREGRL